MSVWGYLGLRWFFPSFATGGESTENEISIFPDRTISYKEYRTRAASIYHNNGTGLGCHEQFLAGATSQGAGAQRMVRNKTPVAPARGKAVQRHGRPPSSLFL